jgi:NADH dehydrogenase/NADH:ubiquinone oxidoreductase subunit G
MNTAHLIVDGIKVSVLKGTTILEAAESAGITIPRLCHQEGIKPSGNCRICVVEVEGSRTLVGSCHTPVAEGMIITTNSIRVRKARQDRKSVV